MLYGVASTILLLALVTLGVAFFLMGATSDALLNDILWVNFYKSARDVGLSMALCAALVAIFGNQLELVPNRGG